MRTGCDALKRSAAAVMMLMIGTVMAALPRPARAADPYPNRTIMFVVPYGPGGGVDIVGRALAVGLSKQLKQSVIVENRPGGGSTIGTAYVSRANPDGYTVLIGDASALTMAPSLYAHLTYSIAKNFAPVTQVATSALCVAVNPSLPVNSMDELIAYAKANPGKINYSSPGTGTIPHLSGVLFETLTHTHLTHIPYKSGAEAVTALLGGQVQLSFAQVPLAAPMLATGKLKVFGVSSAQRSALMPQVPTISEAGVSGYLSTSWVSEMVPAGTPPEVIQTLYRASIAALQDPETRNALIHAGFDVVGSTTPALAQLIATDGKKWSDVIHSAGIEAQ